MNAIVSIVGSYTDNNAVKDPHVPAYSYLTWDDINELLASGRIEIGNHTYNMHSNTSARRGCSINSGETAEQYAEIFGTDISLLQTEIHRFTGQSAFVFAYPYGMVCQESIPVLRENGIYITLTCWELPNYISHETDCLYNLGRYNRSGKYSTEEFMEKVLEQK
jgi:peptidoglycan/xylan/chitin deacetylase (PgdA/CDA1 family)